MESTLSHQAVSKSVEEARSTSPRVSLDVIDVLDGFFVMEKRSETLDGSVPLRAAQGCKPFLDGNAAGFQLRFSLPARLQVKTSGFVLELADQRYFDQEGEYAARIQELIRRGLIAEGGYWHRELQKGIAFEEDGILSLFTGLLIRPASGVWLLLSGASNRRSRVDLLECVFCDERSFVPVILRIDISSKRGQEVWLDLELGCITPLRPNVSMTISPLEEEPRVGHAFNDFYQERYFTRKAEKKPTGSYRKLVAREPQEAREGHAQCHLFIAGENIHRVDTFHRFATALGEVSKNPTEDDLQFGVVCNIADFQGHWDGQKVRDLSVNMPTESVQKFRATWERLFGKEHVSKIDWLEEYAIERPGLVWGEPFLQIAPWVFAMTPPGWSSITEELHVGELEGLRGVISTDSFFHLGFVYQFYKPCHFEIARGTPLARVLPVPRALLKSSFRMLSLEESS